LICCGIITRQKGHPDQPRDTNGRWTNGSGGASKPIEMIRYKPKGQSGSYKQMNKEVQNDSKLKNVDRVDKADKGKDSQPHIHFGAGGKSGAVYKDGTIKHPVSDNVITRYIMEWMKYHGYNPPH
jgi:hypothetical protein